MRLEDWFNPEDRAHLKAYDIRVRMGAWPHDFNWPADVEEKLTSLIAIGFKIADFYVKEVLSRKRYEHFKGGIYSLRGIASLVDTNDGVPAVVYESEKDRRQFVRTLSNFNERIERPEYQGPRFKEI